MYQKELCVVSTKISLFVPEKTPGGNPYHPAIIMNCFELCKESRIISSSGAKPETKVDRLSHIFTNRKITARKNKPLSCGCVRYTAVLWSNPYKVENNRIVLARSRGIIF